MQEEQGRTRFPPSTSRNKMNIQNSGEEEREWTPITYIFGNCYKRKEKSTGKISPLSSGSHLCRILQTIQREFWCQLVYIYLILRSVSPFTFYCHFFHTMYIYPTMIHDSRFLYLVLKINTYEKCTISFRNGPCGDNRKNYIILNIYNRNTHRVSVIQDSLT